MACLPRSVLKNGRVSCAAPSPLAPSSHTPPAVPKGKQLGGKTHGGGARQHDKRKKASSSATEQTDPAVLCLATGKTVPPKISAQHDRGVAAGGIVPADSKPTTQRGMLSLEEVEKTLYTHPSIGSSHPIAPHLTPLFRHASPPHPTPPSHLTLNTHRPLQYRPPSCSIEIPLTDTSILQSVATETGAALSE